LSVVLLGPALNGCSKKAEQQTAGAASAMPTALATASGAASSSAADSGSPGAPGDVGARKIPAGPAPNGTWTIEFGLERVNGDENLDWAGAIAHCQEKGKQLCLETQWQRACSLDPKIGTLESWTLTADYPGSAVRGGAEGCKTRAFRKVAEKNPTRIGLCCDRAVAITSTDIPVELRAAASKRILDVEAALGDLSPGGRASKLLFDEVSLDGTDYKRDLALLKLLDERKADPKRLQFYDLCSIKLSEDPTPMLLADCGVIQQNLGKTRGFPQRIAFQSETGPVVYLGDPKAMKAKERKERVKAFLPSE
jgi:hypothetical protein